MHTPPDNAIPNTHTCTDTHRKEDFASVPTFQFGGKSRVSFHEITQKKKKKKKGDVKKK